MNIPYDKKLHFFTGLPGGVLFAILGNWVGLGWTASVMMGSLGSAGAGIANECLQAGQNWLARRQNLKEPHTVDAMDAAASWAGGTFGALIWLGWKVLHG